MTDKLWEPSAERAGGTRIAEFMRRCGIGIDGDAFDYDALWQWSIERPELFWPAVWDFAELIGDRGDRALQPDDDIRRVAFFPDARLNYAENLLRRADDGEAVIFWTEYGDRRSKSWHQLRKDVAVLAAALKREGIGPGDRVAGIVANTPETLVAMLATASLGAVWSSCSPDFGARGILDRFAQVEPKIVFCCDHYVYHERRFNVLATAEAAVRQMKSVVRLVVLPYNGRSRIPSDDEGFGVDLAEYCSGDSPAEPEFARVGFADPLFIMFSSGTTGPPKCIVHGTGGALVQHVKEHQLQCDIRSGDRLLYFTTCGWMMWNWTVSALASGASVVLYDGSPMCPDATRLAEIAEWEGVTHFGASAKYFDACSRSEVMPAGTSLLRNLRTILSTGSPLSPESFDYIYKCWKSDICLSSIGGGTDILGCFAGGSPIDAVYRGQCQKRLLGMDVQVFSPEGAPIREGAGELVCRNAHPSMPTEFLNDPDGARYSAAYFERFPGVWHHGDWVTLTREGGLIYFGRSDATLNPGGVRIGTAEIYRPVETLDEIVEALVIERRIAGGTELVLFIRLKPCEELTRELEDRIRTAIKSSATPRHVPAKIVAVSDIPRTKSGKIVELAVRSVVHGEEVKNVDVLANPEALDLYRDLPELRN